MTAIIVIQSDKNNMSRRHVWCHVVSRVYYQPEQVLRASLTALYSAVNK